MLTFSENLSEPKFYLKSSGLSVFCLPVEKASLLSASPMNLPTEIATSLACQDPADCLLQTPLLQDVEMTLGLPPPTGIIFLGGGDGVCWTICAVTRPPERPKALSAGWLWRDLCASSDHTCFLSDSLV